MDILVVYGLTAILIESPLFSWLRGLIRKTPARKLASCYQCLGLWVGLMMGWITGERGWELVRLGLASSGLCFFASRLTSPPIPLPPSNVR
jgi:hypothetical protein